MLTRNILDRRRMKKIRNQGAKRFLVITKKQEKMPYVCLPSSINHLCVNSIFVSVFALTELSVNARIQWQDSLVRSYKRLKENLKIEDITCPSSEPGPWCWWCEEVLLSIIDFFLSLQRLFWNHTRITRGLSPVISTNCSFIIASGRGFAA